MFDSDLWLRFFFAFVVVLVLIGLTAFLVRRFGGERLGASSSRGRQPRLAVIDAAAVDGRRRLILIRRDNVEHLLLIGGPSDVVVETNIVRAAAPARDAAGPRPPAAPADTMPRAAPQNEGNMWPLQPEPVPAPRPPRQPAMDEPVQWHADPEPPPPQRRAEVRPEARQEPRSEPRSEPRPVDPLAGLAAELARVQPEAPAPKARPQQREREIARARAPQPDRARPAPPAADEQFATGADQNLAEMAQRLEAALRRPKPAEPRAPDAAPRQQAMAAPAALESMLDVAPPPMTEAPTHHEDAAAPQQQAPTRAAAAKPAAPKSVYDSLEQEMASLLGRPNTKT